MTKILKKSLACLLVFVLCFTAIAGCLSVSAEAPGCSFGYGVYFANNNSVSAVCEGSNIRAQISGTSLKENTTYGISLSLPDGAEITKINSFGTATGEEIKRHFNEEEDILKLVIKTYTAGTWTTVVYFDITEEMEMKEYYVDCAVEAALTSDGELYTAEFSHQIEVCEHSIVTDPAVAPGCETTGLTEGSHCSIGGEVIVPQKEVEALGHTEVDVEAVAPTCTTTGLTAGKKCSVCGAFTVPQEEVEATGHDYGEGVIDPNATCTTEGVITYTCVNGCGDSYTEAISAKGHTEVAYADKAATCTEDGQTGGTYCDVCKAEITAPTVVPALGHDYGEPVDNGNGTHTATCANDANHTITEDHDFTNGDCVCGAVEAPAGPTIDDTLVFAGAAVGFGTSSLQVNFRIRNNLLTKYSNMELVIVPQKYDATTLNLVEDVDEIVVPYAKLAGSGTFRTYAYADIYLYELGLEIQYMLRGIDTDGNTVVSPTYSTSPADYLKNLVPSDDLMATLIADTLVAGEKAAIAFGAEGSDLAAAPSILEGFDYSAATQEFDMESCNKVDTHNATNADWGVGSTGTHRMSKSVTIGKVPYISYRIRGGSSIDLDKMQITVSYTQITGVGTTAQYSRTFTSADTANLYKQGSFVMFKFDDIGLGDGNSDITFVATYDGAEVFNSVYSIETYFYNNMTTLSTELQELATALLKLGSSFRAKMA